MRWRQDTPSATYLVSLIVAPLVKIHDAWHGVPVDYYVYHEDSALARRAVPRHADMIDVYSTPHRRSVSVGQVRADDGGRFLRRHGERQRHDARGLAPRRARLRRPAVVPVDPHPARARASVVRRLRDDGELGQHVAQRRVRRVHAGPVLGEQARRARRGGLLPGRVPAVHAASTRSARCRSRRSDRTTSIPRARSCSRCSSDYLGPERFWAAIHRYLTDHAFGNATTRRPAPGGARGHG